MTTEVTFLNGLNTIGGNIVSFTNGKTRIIMDFGVPSDPRDGDSTSDLIQQGILPNTPELFDAKAQQLFDHQAIFISHLHIDHIGALKFLKAELPIYMTTDSKKLYEDLIASGDEAAVANLQAVDYERPVKVGPFSISFFKSDHDIIGASAIRVVDDEGHIFVYSGDVRYNGPDPQSVAHWAKSVAKPQADLFLLEGTSFSFDDEKGDHAEKIVPDVEGSLVELFSDKLSSNHLLVINPYPRNVARLYALEQAAREFGRPIVWEKFYADLLKQFYSQTHPLILGKEVDLSEIIAYPENYVLQNSFQILDNLADFYQPIFLQMNGEPLGDYDPRYRVQQEKLQKFAAEFIYAGASGHAVKSDLIKIAQQVKAKLTIPWHSFKPETEARVLEEAGLRVKLPHKNETMVFN
ncbi:MAG: MBL fold metallo-hydrolase [Oenococcus sp.]|uniref:MBL fold metallo-hydrolase n=1 Tax=Oenococcus sp. TaxID=1979414 RepID=UPI0039EAB8C7